ncbi:hypothetical protein [Pleionea sediminis]|uniref:hypothetical protein n=1 Tax=Pleionea sediminis TaxID=2569479 RepID=UPI0013DE6295|nr:hypothetical protein [Pleionea sediminis]
MTSKPDQPIEIEDNTKSTDGNKKQAVIKATIIGLVCGVLFMLAAKMVNIAMT